MKRTHYRVTYANRLARFSDYRDAMAYARMISWHCGSAEVHAVTGIVGQYENGKTTPEFKEHHRAALGDKDEARQ